MEAPVPAVPSRDTGLPPGVHLAPLGQRFAAFLIDSSVPAVVGIVLAVLVPGMSGGTRAALILIGAALILGWGILVWFMLAVRAASPGMQVMKLQLVGFYDGRPAGLVRIALRTLILRGLGATGLGGLLLLIFLLQHPRRQGWHDLVAKAVVIQKRQLAPRPPSETSAASAGPAAASAGSAAAPAGSARASAPAGPETSAAPPTAPAPLAPPPGVGPYGAPPQQPAPYGVPPQQPAPYSPAPYSPAPYSPAPSNPPPAAPYQPVRPTPHSATSAGEHPPDRQPWSGPSSPQSQSSGPSYPQSQPSAPPYVPGPPGVPSQLPTQPPAPPFVPSQPSERAPGPSSSVPSAAPPGIPGPYPGVFAPSGSAAPAAGTSPDQGTAGSGQERDGAPAGRSAQWAMLLDDGRRIAIDGLVLLGRNPQPRPGEEDAQLIKIADETRTVSKLHLALGVQPDGTAYVIDRGSTNGSTVTTLAGVSTHCPPDRPVQVEPGSIVSIGDHWLELRRDES